MGLEQRSAKRFDSYFPRGPVIRQYLYCYNFLQNRFICCLEQWIELQGLSFIWSFSATISISAAHSIGIIDVASTHGTIGRNL